MEKTRKSLDGVEEDAPLGPLHEGDVARRDPEPARKLGLGEARAPAEPPDVRGKGLGGGHAGKVACAPCLR